MAEPAPGILLISDPFLKDPNFQRTVILLCEHDQEGSFGFVINKLHHQVLGEIMELLDGCNFPVFVGGPVQKDSLHFIHRKPGLLGGTEIMDGIFWGGDFELVLSLILTKELEEADIRFLIGYSGWGAGQLEEELKEKSWITRNATRRLAFYKNVDEIWKEALYDLGGEYQQMIHYPKDPQLN